MSKSSPNGKTAIPVWPSAATSFAKLEYIVPDAISSNADTLVSIGGVQSNHTRIVAAVAAKIGVKNRLIQGNRVPHQEAVYDRGGDMLPPPLTVAQIPLVDRGCFADRR